MNVDIQKAFLDNALRYYTDPPENGVLELGVRDPSLLKQLADKIYAHQVKNSNHSFAPAVRPGHKPTLYLRWAYRQSGLKVNFEIEAGEDRVAFTALGTF